MNHFYIFSGLLILSFSASSLWSEKSILAKPRQLNDSFSLSRHFPQLIEITRGIEEKAPEIRSGKVNIAHTRANRTIVDSQKGLSANINLSGQSIHENRPGVSYAQTYRTVGSIFIKKPIYHWGILKSRSRIAKLDEDFAKQKLNIDRSNLVNLINSKFMDLILLSRSIILEKESLNLIRKIEEELIQKKEAGIITELKVSEQKILSIRKSIEIEELSRILNKNLSSFKFLTGYTKKINLSIPEEFINYCESYDFERKPLQVIGSQSSMEIEQLKTLIKAENENLFIASNAQKPKFNLVSGFYQDQIDLPNSPDSVRRNNFLVGVEANWNIWDSSKSKGERELALAKKRILEIELESNIKKLRLEIESLQTQLLNFAKQISLSKKLVEANKSRHEKSKIEFAQDQITSNDLLSSKISLTEAEVGLVKSIFNYLKASEEYKSHTHFKKL